MFYIQYSCFHAHEVYYFLAIVLIENVFVILEMNPYLTSCLLCERHIEMRVDLF